LTPQYDYMYSSIGNIQGREIDVEEVSLNLRYTYREKRAPVFGYYIPVSTKYPVLYLDVAAGNVGSGFNTNYLKTIAAVMFKHHTNRWGTDLIRVEGGLLLTDNDQSLPRSLLL